MATIPGSNLPDVLYGTIDADLITGLLADDILYGFDGNDRLEGADGDDTLNGGSGDDTLDGGAGEDFFYGGSGNDLVSYASALAGLILDLGLPDHSDGDAEGDFFVSVETFELSAFNDSFYGGSGAERVLGGAGDDMLDGRDGTDSLSGGLGDDLIHGGAAVDTLDGGGGNDVLVGGAGADVLIGGSGTLDIASYGDSLVDLTFDFQTGSLSGDAVGDIFVGIEGVRLSSGNDSAAMGGFFRWVDGGNGADTLTGTAGADTLIGGRGNDVVNGMGGNDVLQAGTADGLSDVGDMDTLNGGSGHDTLDGGAAASMLRGDDGDDLLQGWGDNDDLGGGNGADTLQGGDGQDVLQGGAGADILDGGLGTDRAIYATAVRLDMGDPAQSTGEARGDVLSGIEFVELVGGSVYVGSAVDMFVQATSPSVEALAGSGAETFLNLSSVDYAAATEGITFQTVGVLLGSRGAAGDVLTGINDLYGTNFRDVIDLTDPTVAISINHFYLRGGADTVRLTDRGLANYLMGAGNDRISGSASLAMVDMGTGNDTVDLKNAAGTYLYGDIFGQSGDDLIKLLNYDEDEFAVFVVDGGTGNDTVQGTVLAGDFIGGEGDDLIDLVFRVKLGKDATLQGGLGNDTLIASAIPAIADTGAAITLNGGQGDDALTGTDYAVSHAVDVFAFTGLWGLDTVTGFDVTKDSLVFVDDGAGPGALGDLAIFADGTATVISFVGQTLTLVGVDFASFETSDILFV